jgi:hypothetical protein
VVTWKLAVWGGYPWKCAGTHLTLQIYHGLSVNARLILIGRARRSIGRIGRAARPTDNPGPVYWLGAVISSLQHYRLRITLASNYKFSSTIAKDLSGLKRQSNSVIGPWSATVISDTIWVYDVVNSNSVILYCNGCSNLRRRKLEQGLEALTQTTTSWTEILL